MKAWLRCAGYKDQVTFILKQGSWDLLMSSDTHHKGVCLLAWAMVSLRFQERNWIFHHLMAILNCRDNRRHILATALFIQMSLTGGSSSALTLATSWKTPSWRR
ncbi:maestro heat-like repeat-containing protein family member 7 [Pangshura tecta]